MVQFSVPLCLCGELIRRSRSHRMLDLLELISGIGELLCSWRFICASFFRLPSSVYWLIPDRSICLTFSIPVAVIGLVTGIVWQIRKD